MARWCSWWNQRRNDRGSELDDLAGIHDVVRVECQLDPFHELELHRIRVTLQLEDLELADAVLGREAAAEITDQVVDGALDLGLHGLQLRHLAAGPLIDVE